MTTVLVHRLRQDFVLPVTFIVGCGGSYGPGCYQGEIKLCYVKLSSIQHGNWPLYSEAVLSCPPTQVVHLTLALATRAVLQLRNSLSARLCRELASIAPVVTCPTSMTCFTHLTVTELPASRTRGMKGEAFRAHSHLSERSESSQGLSSCIKGVTVQAALCASLQPCTGQPRTLPARTINRTLGCAPGNSTLLI